MQEIHIAEEDGAFIGRVIENGSDEGTTIDRFLHIILSGRT